MSERNLRKTQVGIVTSDKMDKTVVVSVKDRVKHPLYKKSSIVPLSLKHMTKTMSAESATEFSLWKHVPCPRTRDGV